MKQPVKRTATVFLLVASLIVWGIAGMRIYRSLEAPSLEVGAIHQSLQRKSPPLPDLPTEAEFAGQISVVRNPFLPQKKRIVRKRRSVGKSPSPVQKLQITYVGYLAGEKGPLAIVEEGGDRIRFRSVGDSVFGIKVIAIEPERLGIRRGKITDWVPLRN